MLVQTKEGGQKSYDTLSFPPTDTVSHAKVQDAPCVDGQSSTASAQMKESFTLFEMFFDAYSQAKP